MLVTKKIIVIEAMQFMGHAGEPKDWLDDAMAFDEWLDKKAKAAGVACKYRGSQLIIPTLEGEHAADPGDWIACGVKGELYPIKEAIFAETYEIAGTNGWVAHHEPMGAMVWTEERPEPHPYLEDIRPATSLEKHLLQAMGGTSDGLYDARSLAAAVQLFRNEPMLKDLGKLRGTWGFARLCDSWDTFVEAWPETRLNTEQMEAMKEKF